jgi:hypothetical protein
LLVLPNSTYRFNAIQIKIPASYPVDSYKIFLKFIWKGKGLTVANTILKKNKEY